MKRSIKRALLLTCTLLPAAMLLLLTLSGGDLEVTRYEITTDKLTSDLKIAFLSDLHSREYGEGNGELIRKIRDYQPDIILMGGDMVSYTDRDVSVALELCEALTGVADIYYIYGNHEGILQYASDGAQIPLDRYLTDRGVKVLYGGVYEIEHKGGTIGLLAKSMHAEDYFESPANRDLVEDFMERSGFKLVMSHYPDLIHEALKDQKFDLAVAGHYHGGQVIIPGIGGVYHGDTGFFPEYYGGAYQMRHGTLIISRGLGDSTILPRINNNPELVLIDVRNENE